MTSNYDVYKHLTPRTMRVEMRQHRDQVDVVLADRLPLPLRWAWPRKMRKRRVLREVSKKDAKWLTRQLEESGRFVVWCY